MCLKQFSSVHNKNWGAQNNWGRLPRISAAK